MPETLPNLRAETTQSGFGNGVIVVAALRRRHMVARPVLIHPQKVAVAGLHAARVLDAAFLDCDRGIPVALLIGGRAVVVAVLIYPRPVARFRAGGGDDGERDVAASTRHK